MPVWARAVDQSLLRGPETRWAIETWSHRVGIEPFLARRKSRAVGGLKGELRAGDGMADGVGHDTTQDIFFL